MIDQKLTWDEIISKFTKFEDDFKNNPTDDNLTLLFDNLATKVLNSGFDKDQLRKINDKIGHIRKLFAEKQAELLKKGTDATAKQAQIGKYVNSAKINLK